GRSQAGLGERICPPGPESAVRTDAEAAGEARRHHVPPVAADLSGSRNHARGGAVPEFPILGRPPGPEGAVRLDGENMRFRMGDVQPLGRSDLDGHGPWGGGAIAEQVYSMISPRPERAVRLDSESGARGQT